MPQSVEYVNDNDFIRFADYTESDSDTGHLPVIRYQGGQAVSSADQLGFASTYTMIQRYADGAVHFYTLANEDGSRIQLIFEDPGSSPTSSNAAFFGIDNQTHGRLTDSLYVSATSLPDGGSPFFIGQHFSDGHLTKYALITKDQQASLTGTYDVDTKAATLSIVTVNGNTSTSGFGQIDALTKIDAARLIGQDGNGFISDHGAEFKIVSDHGNGLIGQDGNGWSVVSNDGGTITKLIGQDGNGLNLLDPASIISQDGNGLVATVTGNIVAQGGLNIVAQGGLNLDDFNLSTMAARDVVELLNPGSGEISTASISDLSAGDPVTALGDFSAHVFNGVRSLKALTDNVVDLTIPAAFLDHTTSGEPYHYGETLTVSWQVRNAGFGTSGVTTSQVYMSTDNVISGDDKLIGSLIDPAIAGGTAIADNFNYVLPSTLTPGATYYIYTVANAVDHTNPADNTSEDRTNNISNFMSFTVESASTVPDLTVPVILLGKTSGHAGDTVNVSWQVKENANVASGLSTSKVYLSTDATIDSSDELLASLPDPAIAPGNALGDTLDVKLRSDLAPGTYYIGVIADSDNAVAEIDENNNTSAVQFTVTGNTARPKIGVVDANVTVHADGYSFDVLGTAGSGTTVHIMLGTADLGQVAIDAQGHWSYGAFIPGSSTNLSAVAIDSAGNTTTVALLNASVTGGVSTGKGDDVLNGDDTVNILNGQSGDDMLIGGGGGDTLIGDKGQDAASYETALTGVTASLLKPATNTGDAEGDTYSSIEDLRGSNYDDTLVGDEQQNFLYGGTGADKFVFAKFNAHKEVDGIYDFHHAEHDKIVLAHRIFTTLIETNAEHPFNHNLFKDLGAKGAREDSSDRILYNSQNGELAYDRDGSGHKFHAFTFAQLVNPEHLNASDFMVI